jgi:hypothetical protein
MKNKNGYMNAQDIAVEAAMEAIKRYKQDEKEKIKKTRMHNIGLLMTHYLDFVEHYDNIKHKASDIQEELQMEYEEELDFDDIIIHSIKRSRLRTKIMIEQIETAVLLTERQMEQRNEKEKIEALKRIYMDPAKKNIKFNQRIIIVAEEIGNCHEATIRRWNKEMLNELAVKLFGVDGLQLDV